jgi:hypothetical protein
LTGCFAILIHSFVDFNLQITANAQLFLALAALATPGSSANRTRAQASPAADGALAEAIATDE